MILSNLKRKYGIKEIGEILLFLILAMGFSFISAFFFGNIGFTINSPLLADLFARIGQLLGLFGFIIIWYRNVSIFSKFGLKLKGKQVVSFVILGLLLGFALQLTLFLLFTNLEQHIYLPPISIMSWILKGLLPAIIIHACVSVSEELLFRGYLLSKLQNLFHTPIAVSIQATLFSLTHYFNSGFSIMAFIGLFVFGVLMALLKFKSESLIFPIAFHLIWNVSEGSIFGFPVSGEKPISIVEVKTAEPTSLIFGGAFGPEESLLCILVLSLTTISLIIAMISQKKRTTKHSTYGIGQN